MYSVCLSVCLYVRPSEIALQQVSMFFRSDPKWEVLEPLRDVGKTGGRSELDWKLFFYICMWTSWCLGWHIFIISAVTRCYSLVFNNVHLNSLLFGLYKNLKWTVKNSHSDFLKPEVFSSKWYFTLREDRKEAANPHSGLTVSASLVFIVKVTRLCLFKDSVCSQFSLWLWWIQRVIWMIDDCFLGPGDVFAWLLILNQMIERNVNTVIDNHCFQLPLHRHSTRRSDYLSLLQPI